MQKEWECKPSWQVVNLWEQKQSQNHLGECISKRVETLTAIQSWQFNTPLFICCIRAPRVSASCWGTDARARVQLTDSSNRKHILMFFTAAALMCLHHLSGHMTRPAACFRTRHWAAHIISCLKRLLFGFRWSKLVLSTLNYQSKPVWSVKTGWSLAEDPLQAGLNSRKVFIFDRKDPLVHAVQLKWPVVLSLETNSLTLHSASGVFVNPLLVFWCPLASYVHKRIILWTEELK